MYRSKLHIEVNEQDEEIAAVASNTTTAAGAAAAAATAATATKPTTANTTAAATATKTTATSKAPTVTAAATTTATTTTTTSTTTETTDAKLKSLSLRGNQLCGSILIGNYSHLTYLEVTENEMEILDLSTLGQLVMLKCSNNKLMELMINGKNLCKIVASNNCLHTLTVSPVPVKLIHLDISRNNFTVLPSWVAGTATLQILDAQHNQLQTLMEFCTNYQIDALQRLNLSYNALRTLPKRAPAGWGSLHTLQLHSNELQQLPENLFAVTWRQLATLNVSCNRLSALPASMQMPMPSTTSAAGGSSMKQHTSPQQPWHLETLLATSNLLDERIFDVLATCGRLRVLHAAYNKISSLSVRHVRSWSALEELVLAGNLLQRLPENLASLQRLQVLRVHSNLLLSLPTNLSKLTQLRVLDVAHNHISHVNLQHLLARSLKYLDLSCNLQLQVDEQQLRECQAQKHWSFVDVTGKNRACLPTAKSFNEKDAPPLEPNGGRSGGNKALVAPWCVGFSETPGKCRRLHVAQVHRCNYHLDESCLYGMLDCGVDARNTTTTTTNALSTLCKLLPKVLQQEQDREQHHGPKDIRGDYLKHTLMIAQQKLFNDDGSTPLTAAADGGGIILCHIAKESNASSAASTRSFVKSNKTKRYVLRVASVGSVSAYLIRKTSNVRLTGPMEASRQTAALIEESADIMSSVAAAAAAVVTEVPLSNEDEYLILCNAELWTALDVDRVAREIRKEENVVLAAKRLQNIAQSFGADGNLSVLVVRLRNIGTDVDQMIRELKQIVRKKPKPISGMVTARVHNVQRLYERQGAPTGGTVSSASGGGALSRIQQQQQLQQQLQQQQQPAMIVRSERSSPSGQSDKTPMHAALRSDGGGVGVGAECELELLEETDSVLSEEQFKCWEYMLEQNTQLLFDKELNTISKSFSSGRQYAPSSPPPLQTQAQSPLLFQHTNASELADYKPTNLLKSINNKFISTSSPHLLLQNTQDDAMPYQHHHHQPQQQQQQHHHHHHHYQQQPTPAAATPHHHKQQLSFLSKYFGSCRSFQATPALAGGYNLGEARQSRDSLLSAAKHASVIGGPHAAYFGSLQRLMPYNLEYDFAVTQERVPVYDEERDFSGDGCTMDGDNDRDDLIGGAGHDDDDDDDDDDDYLAHDCRMRKYWGVATTEL